MAISDKLEYLNDTKQLLKDKINNLGGSIDDNTTFREYANQLQNVYDNYPKTEYQEGTEITLSNTLKGKLDYDNGIVGIGQSSQDGTPTPSTPIAINSVTGNQDVVVSGKNLVPFPYYDSDVQDRNGVNWSVNENGTINATGTANASSSIFYLTNGDSDIYLKAGTYKISTNLFIDPNGFSVQVISIVNGNYGTVYWNDIVLTETTRLRIRVIAKPNTTVNVQNAYLMIERGNQATAYEKYKTPKTYQFSIGDKELFEECTIVGSPDNWKFVDNYAKKTMRGDDIVRLTAEVSVGTNYRHLIQFAEGTDASMAWCNYAKFLKNYTADNVHFYLYTNQLILFVPLTYQELKARADVVPLEVVYPLATPIETPITDETLISQLNAWYNAHSNNGTTIITSNGNLPMIMKVRGLKGE